MTKYIILRSPSDLQRKDKKKEITQYLRNGMKTYEILLMIEFVSTDEVIHNLLNQFRIMKNQIQFNLKNS